MGLFDRLDRSPRMPTPEEALAGSAAPIAPPERHFVSGARLAPPFPDGLEEAMFGLGCFWGAERALWQAEGVYSTMVGYSAGFTVNPTYKQVCTGQTGHNEVVKVIYDPTKTTFDALLALFWESHDPTQGMRQGNDRGTQYRSGIYTFSPAQREAALTSKAAYQAALKEGGHPGTITTEVLDAGPFYYAEGYHQQYLAKNPDGYCGLGGTGVACPIGVGGVGARAR
jgi:peptide-methionine (S)-S-oxide reductase